MPSLPVIASTLALSARAEPSTAAIGESRVILLIGGPSGSLDREQQRVARLPAGVADDVGGRVGGLDVPLATLGELVPVLAGDQRHQLTATAEEAVDDAAR